MHRDLADWRERLGALSVALAIVAAVITIAQTLRGEVRRTRYPFFCSAS